MDLISREAAIEALALNTDYQTPEGIKNDLINHPGKECDWLGGIDAAISIIEELPSVPAVPLDKLCELLADMGSGKNNTLCIECCGSEGVKCPDENCLCNNPYAWKCHLTKWMEGLE